jgi:hypothetical protein
MLIISPSIIYHEWRNKMTVPLPEWIFSTGKKAIGVGPKRDKEPASTKTAGGSNLLVSCTLYGEI